MGIFDKYDLEHKKELFGDKVIVTAAEALDRPFIIENLRIKENHRGKFGTKDLVIVDVSFTDTIVPEASRLMLQQTLLVSKMRFLFTEGWPKDAEFVIIKSKSMDGSAQYYDLVENIEEVVEQ